MEKNDRLQQPSRRRFLAGLGGAALSLPWLESMAVAGNRDKADAFIGRIGSASPQKDGWYWPKVSGREVMDILSEFDCL